MEKLLILGAGDFQKPLIQKAKDKGLFTIAMSPEGDYPGLDIAHKVYYHDATDTEFVVKTAREEGVAGIASDQGEIFVNTIAAACEQLGLPGNSPETAEIYTNKGLTRKRGRELGLATIDSYVAETLEDALGCFRNIGGNAIIKPLDGFSSKGVFLIESEEDLRRYYDDAVSISKKNAVIVEQLIRGREVEVNSIAFNHNVRPYMYGEIWPFHVKNVFSSRMRLYPIKEERDSLERLLAYDKRINEGFGITQGITHNEYIIEEGTGEVYLVDAALRGGGAFVGSDIIRLQTDLDINDFLIDAAIGKATGIPAFQTERCHCGIVAFYIPVGKVLSYEGLDEVEQLDYVHRTTFDKIRKGQIPDTIRNKDQRQLVVLSADSREELLTRIDAIKNTIKIKVKNESGVEDVIWE